MQERESISFDVLIVGAGPAGLSAAIRLKQLAREKAQEISVCVLEKGAEVGAHILSGAVFDPIALNELIPEWKSLGAPLNTAVTSDHFFLLTAKRKFKLPTPKPLQNHGNYIISLGLLCRWLAKQAEQLGVEIFPGFAGSEILYNENGEVCGVATGDVGVGKNGNPTAHFQRGMEIHAKNTLFAEGCRGSLAEQVIQKFNLRENSQPQTYGIGIKELWEVDNDLHTPGTVIHSVGWPLDHKTYGGSFLYQLDEKKIAVGFVVGLDYQNPYLSPYETFQRFKTHPHIAPYFKNGRVLEYGARALNEGGWQSIPTLSFPGGSLIGCSAGFLNVPRIKGSHTAMKSGMLAAEAIVANTSFESSLRASWIGTELHRARNIRPAFRFGLLPGLAYAAFDTLILRGKAPWTFTQHVDHLQLKPAAQCKPLPPYKADGQLTFDRLTSLQWSNVNHEENQPSHLRLKDPKKAISINFKLYHSPESIYCPANVYEIVYTKNKEEELQINAQNCIHCKTCDIKDPTQNIVWVTPESGGGPNYSLM